jgi:hypothetical protein
MFADRKTLIIQKQIINIKNLIKMNEIHAEISNNADENNEYLFSIRDNNCKQLAVNLVLKSNFVLFCIDTMASVNDMDENTYNSWHRQRYGFVKISNPNPNHVFFFSNHNRIKSDSHSILFETNPNRLESKSNQKRIKKSKK